MTVKLGINGFGRIGRSVFRAALKNSDVEVLHINDLTETSMLAHLLKYDSVHGTLEGDVVAEDNRILVNGKSAASVSAERDPSQIDWKSRGVDIVLECTGIFRSREQASLHLKAGAQKVIISAPAKDEDITVVCGVNDDKLNADHRLISNGSCTTNCLAPVAKVLQDSFGIEHGLMTTIHSYTNDQKILDLPHSDKRRARAAALSMIPTSTGAAKAIALVMPELKGKMHGLAVRVPTPNVSLVDVTFQLKNSATVKDVNDALRAAANGPMKGILGYTDDELVSCDFNGRPESSYVDGDMTSVVGENMVKVLSWYDNETGFSHRMIDVAKKISSLN